MPLVAHVPKHLEQRIGFLGGEHGGGLVQDEDVRAAVEHFYNFHRLLLRHAHFVNLALQVDLEAVFFGKRADIALNLLHIQPKLARQAQDDVFRGGKHVHQLKMLMNHAYTQSESVLGRADHHLAAVHKNMPRVREIDAG